MVIVLHDINAAADSADRIVTMKDGRGAAQDACAALLAPEALDAVFDTPFQVLNTGDRPVVARQLRWLARLRTAAAACENHTRKLLLGTRTP